MAVTLYTQPNCQGCIATKRFMTSHGISFGTVDISENEAARKLVQDLGYQSVPVVVAGDDHWNGFNPDKLMALREQTLRER